MSTIGQRIKEKRIERNMTQFELAEKLGYKSKSSINKIELDGRNLTQSKIKKLADALQTTPGYIMGWEEDVSFVTIPVFASVSAGTGAFADGNIEGYTDIPISMARKGDFFGLRVDGDSMEPTIHDNDIIIVNREGIPRDGQIVVAVVNGDEGFCKRFTRHDNGIGLMSDNPIYKPMIFSRAEVESKPVRILGTVNRIIRDIA